MFGDPVTNPKGWNRAKIKALGKVTTGNTPSRKHSEYYGTYIEWIKSDNINTPHYFLTTAEEFLSQEGYKVARTAPKNSILVTCIAGSRECIGNAAMADREVAFNQQINSVTPPEHVDPYFFFVQILLAKKLIQAASTDSMKGLVSKSRFEQIELIEPPLPDQELFGNWYQNYIRLNRRLLVALDCAQVQFASIQQRAFRGDL